MCRVCLRQVRHGPCVLKTGVACAVCTCNDAIVVQYCCVVCKMCDVETLPQTSSEHLMPNAEIVKVAVGWTRQGRVRVRVSVQVAVGWAT